MTVEANPAGVPERGAQLTLAGPADKHDPQRLPLRGDLAHIRLAGKWFVPHYAVPMERVLETDAALRKAGREDGEAICTLLAGERFCVLDLSGGWAWGQVGDDGLVGYVPVNALAEPSIEAPVETPVEAGQ